MSYEVRLLPSGHVIATGAVLPPTVYLGATWVDAHEVVDIEKRFENQAGETVEHAVVYVRPAAARQETPRR